MTTSTEQVGRLHLRAIAVGAALVLVMVELVVGRNYLLRSVRVLGHAEPVWIALAIVAAVASMAQFARTQRRMLRAAGTHVSIRDMIRLVFEANAINMTLPGGTAFSVAYAASRLRNLGASSVGAGFALVASGVLSGVTFWGLALGYAGFAGGSASAWAFVVLICVLICAAAGLALLAWRRPGSVGRSVQAVAAGIAGLLERRRHRRSAGAVRRFAGELGAVRPRGRDWAVGTAFAALNWLTDLGCLVVCCLAVSPHTAPLPAIVAAYFAGMTASSISVLPGGFGVIEVAMIVAFASGGVPAVAAAPAVLLYRLVSCVLVVAAGWLAWLAARRRSRRPDTVTAGEGALVS